MGPSQREDHWLETRDLVTWPDRVAAARAWGGGSQSPPSQEGRRTWLMAGKERGQACVWCLV